MEISLGTKVTSANLFKITEINWISSFQSSQVTFDLTRLEWIGNSEVGFFLGWIRSLDSFGIKVALQLQSQADSKSKTQYARRKYCLEKLIFDWGLKELLPASVVLFTGDIPISSFRSKRCEFVPIKILKFDPQTFDSDFDQLYKSNVTALSNRYKLLLKTTDLTYYDVDFLNYSIVKELYSNVCMHSDSLKSRECYFALAINKKFTPTASGAAISAERIEELSSLDRAYYSVDAGYRNIDYVEINFSDFGLGIAKTLSTKYGQESEASLREYFGDEFDIHVRQNLESRILHYALLLFSSQYEVDKQFELHDFIPRGLYTIERIVEKHQGYLEIISNAGGIGVSFKDGIKELTFVSSSNTKVLFPGTRVRIVFPEREKKIPTPKSQIWNSSPLHKIEIENADLEYINGYSLQIDHCIPNQIDHRIPPVLTTTFS